MNVKINTNNVRDDARQVEVAAIAALNMLHAETPRAKFRRLESVHDLASAIEKAIAATDRDDLKIIITEDGGAIPTGYHYQAKADILRVTLTRDVDVWHAEIRAERTHAPKRSGGDDGRRTTRILRDGQSQGRTLR